MLKPVDIYSIPEELRLGCLENCRVRIHDQQRQRNEAAEILARLARQPGVVLADEVGMGKTYVALAVAYAVTIQNPRGPVVVMVPKNLVDKWCRDLDAFCELYLPGRKALNCRDAATEADLMKPNVLRYGTAFHSLEYLKFLDDHKRVRCHIIFLAHGAMSRGLNDEWVRLALIQETLRRYKHNPRLQEIGKQIHRFLAELLWARFRQKAAASRENIWQKLLSYDPGQWKNIYNSELKNSKYALGDDPVPEAVMKAIPQIDLSAFAAALETMPIRASSDQSRLSERINGARQALRWEEKALWRHIVSTAKWRSPLLVMDEAHHLKNPDTQLARQLQSPDSETDMQIGDGALSRSFDRMLFLTATPFQLGHNELVRIMRRFGDVRWENSLFGQKDDFHQDLNRLRDMLSAAQLSSVRLFYVWNQLQTVDFSSDVALSDLPSGEGHHLSLKQKIFREALGECKKKRDLAENYLRPWIIRHNKGDTWAGTSISRRERLEGTKILNETGNGGIDIPSDQLMPFYLAARCAADPGKDILGEALSSSYEAFRNTRAKNRAEKDDHPESDMIDPPQSSWFLEEFDDAVKRASGLAHPKMNATVKRVVDLWEQGEKVLVFAFYCQTCRSLRKHISSEMERRIFTHARRRLAGAGLPADDYNIESIIKRIHTNFFGKATSDGRKALDNALTNILARYSASLFNPPMVKMLKGIMRKFLRVRTTLVRAFPIQKFEEMASHSVVRSMLDTLDKSGVSWRDKFDGFLRFLVYECSEKERQDYIIALKKIQTRNIHIIEDENSAATLANIQEATGTTNREARSRLMLAFNTPFFPDVLVCSRVMGEGVDLHRYCRHVIHHDLDWNPSDIEQRTGRIDRLGCKAEGRHPIAIFLPYLSGAADERQYRVMTEREKWFRIVMGQDEVAKLIPDSDDSNQNPLPMEFQKMLMFDLEV